MMFDAQTIFSLYVLRLCKWYIKSMAHEIQKKLGNYFYDGDIVRRGVGTGGAGGADDPNILFWGAVPPPPRHNIMAMKWTQYIAIFEYGTSCM